MSIVIIYLKYVLRMEAMWQWPRYLKTSNAAVEHEFDPFGWSIINWFNSKYFVPSFIPNQQFAHWLGLLWPNTDMYFVNQKLCCFCCNTYAQFYYFIKTERRLEPKFTVWSAVFRFLYFSVVLPATTIMGGRGIQSPHDTQRVNI